LEKARERGIGALFLEENLAFYSHAGFEPAHTLKSADDEEPEAYEANEAAFPKKEKRWQRASSAKAAECRRRRHFSARSRREPELRLLHLLLQRRRFHRPFHDGGVFCVQFVGPYNEHTGRNLARIPQPGRNSGSAASRIDRAATEQPAAAPGGGLQLPGGRCRPSARLRDCHRIRTENYRRSIGLRVTRLRSAAGFSRVESMPRLNKRASF